MTIVNDMIVKAILIFATGMGSPSVAVDITPFPDMETCENARAVIMETHSKKVTNAFGYTVYHGFQPDDFVCKELH